MSHDYLLDPNADVEEERLALLADYLQPLTIGHLGRTGVGPGWDCLEAGAGNGAIARWLHEAVDPGGSVVAADIDTRFLKGLEAPGLEIRECDLRTDSFPPASFDLVHARYLLTHLPDRPGVMARMVDWLRPGGWLVLEEPDVFGPQASVDPVWRRWWDATTRLPQVDPYCGRALPGEVQRHGLVDVAADVEVPVVKAGEPAARLFQLTFTVLGRAFVDNGLLTQTEIDELIARVDEPDFFDFGMTTVSVWGRKPG